MSTKRTIFLTKENEHCYKDCAEKLIDVNGNRKDAITIEFDKKNIVIDVNDDQDLIITITNPDCDLYEIFSRLYGQY